MDNNQNPINEHYKELLLKFIDNSDVPGKKYDEYVKLLSLFISKGNTDYKYNYTYLNDMNKEFSNFLNIVRNKQQILLSISDIIIKAFEDLGLKNTDVYITMDNFFEITKDKKIKIVDNYSISNANIDEKNSKITITYKSAKNKNNVITLKASDIRISDIDKIKKIIKTVFI